MKRDFTRLQQSEPFDLLVCGGGVYGAWTAYDAALRGLKVALVEQGDWASATSSASTKLIHGGLRYLENHDFRLVKKALVERQRLLNHAPHRVWPLRFAVPVYSDSRAGRLMLKAGLLIYDFLAGKLFSSLRHRYFNRYRFSEHFPLLERRELLGGFTYADAQTDDARLVLELVDGAMQAGAVCVNYCKLVSVHETDGQADGATIIDMAGKGELAISARQIVMTAGQWTTQAQESAGWCRVTKGVHLVMPQVLQEEALLLTSPLDGRVFFMIPWYGRTLVGTTDTDYRGDISDLKVDEHEVQYLLDACNRYVRTSWYPHQVLGKYAGLRVMKQGDQSSPSAVSRDWELKRGSNGVLYSIGGKITSSREDAACIVDAICERLGVLRGCATLNHKLPWVPDLPISELVESLKNELQGCGVDAQSVLWLVRRHGRRATAIAKNMSHDQKIHEVIIPGLPFLLHDLLYCAEHEMAVHLHDLLRRRMPLLILARLDEDTLLQLARHVAPLLGWDETKVKREVSMCLDELQ